MEQQTSNLNSQVRKVNEILRGFGKEAVQEIRIGGQVKYGYRPQWVFDAVNQVIGAENWRHEVIKEEIFNHSNQAQAVAEVRLYIKINGEWLCKGSQKGQSQIVKNNVGDAQKGAITNALLKCFSLLSVGSDAYKGLLGAVYNGRNTRPAATAPKPAQTPSKNKQSEKPAKSDDSANPAATESVPEVEGAYPESRMFGGLPAYGLYVRHVNDLTLNNVHLLYVEDFWRLEADDYRKISWDLSSRRPTPAGPGVPGHAVVMDNVERCASTG